MSVKNFCSYDVHMVRREILGQNKSVLLKNPSVLKLACADLCIDDDYDELLYAAEKGHVLLRVRLYLQDKNPHIRAGSIAVIHKNEFTVVKLVGYQKRPLPPKESKKVSRMIAQVFNQQLPC